MNLLWISLLCSIGFHTWSMDSHLEQSGPGFTIYAMDQDKFTCIKCGKKKFIR